MEVNTHIHTHTCIFEKVVDSLLRNRIERIAGCLAGWLSKFYLTFAMVVCCFISEVTVFWCALRMQ